MPWVVAGFVLAVLMAVVVVVVVLGRRRLSDPAASRGGARRPTLGTRLGSVFGRSLGPSLWDEVEERLIAADTGAAIAHRLVAAARETRPQGAADARAALRQAMLEVLGTRDRSLRTGGAPSVVVVVGVNGSGKTTTIAKLAALEVSEGRSVLVGAADTFRAAAADQVVVWGERLGFDVVRGGEGADPASVAFDALSAARARGVDTVVIDTAGRLHSDRNLMEELAKVVRVLAREAGAVDEVLLVIDGSTGQNALVQAAEFTERVGVTGIVATKLDGSAKGGVVLAIEDRMGIPLKLIGVGERAQDLLHFDPSEFVEELLS